MTSVTAFAAPVVVGMMFRPAERARRRSSCTVSRITWSFVYEWIVVMKPWFTPNASCMTLTTGAMQFVVQEAFEITWCLPGSYM